MTPSNASEPITEPTTMAVMERLCCCGELEGKSLARVAEEKPSMGVSLVALPCPLLELESAFWSGVDRLNGK